MLSDVLGAAAVVAIVASLAALIWWIAGLVGQLAACTEAVNGLAQSLDAFCDVVLDHEIRLGRAEQKLLLRRIM